MSSLIENSPELSGIKIRDLRQTDLPALEWDGEFTHFRNVYLDVYKRIQKGTARAWIAETGDNKLIAQVFLQLTCDRPELADGWSRAYLYSFRVKPAYRNHGLGARIIAVMEEFLYQNKFTRLTLNVARENLDAIRLYKRLGFQIVAEEPGVWSYPDHEGKWHTMHEPSWRMEKLISPPQSNGEISG
jgi:ribosomal protein S18 acetylase RimI-like enzyme